jgi:hypothetical protein
VLTEARQPGEDIASYLQRNSIENDHWRRQAARRGYGFIFE